MEFRFFSIFAMTLVVAVAARQVAVPEAAEMNYWTSVFPNTPMPKALPNLLPSSAAGNGMKAALADMGNGYNTDAFMFPFKLYRPRISYRNAAAAAASNPANKDIFFFKSKLRTGINLDMKYLTMNATRTGFLPRKVADSIPFSSQDFAQVLNYFSLQPKSPKSEILKQTIDGCENPPMEGEEKYCVASFESFVDSAVSMLGKNIRLVSTELEKESTQNQKFSIDEGVKLIGTSEIVCHKMEYPYAVFLCHSIDKTDVYRVPLVGEDGTRATALAVCHKDTSGWSPKHLAFQVLKVKPGTVPICHFLAKDSLVWIPN